MGKKKRDEEPTPHPVDPGRRPLLDRGEHFLDGRSFELLERLGLDLPDAFPRDREALSHLFERARLIVADAESEPNDGLLSGCQILKNAVELMRHSRPMHMCIRRNRLQIW